jgi:ring-1,2-phenylacetyl-CoA epoxidase subunit PaaE
MKFHELQVQSITKLTKESVRIDFRLPDELKPEFNFKAGQYITVEMEGVRRDYSLCSSPLDNKLSIGIKSLKDGFVSNFLNSKLKEGDFLKVSTPNGKFGIKSAPDKKRTVLAFAAGSGITPVLSILRYTLQTENQVQFNLFYCNRTPKETMFKEEIEQLTQAYPDNFFPHWFFTRHKQENPLYEGRLNAEKINRLLNTIININEIDEVLVCGPDRMIREITDEFIKAGLSEHKVYFELYNPPETAKTQAIENTTEVEVSLQLDGGIFNFVWNGKKSLLDAALDEGIDAPYSCKGGICSSCMCRLEEGEVKLGENFVLTDADIQEGIIVACCSHPKSNKIKVNFDDI